MIRTLPWVVAGALLAAGAAGAQEAAYSIKQTKAEPPRELNAAVSKQLSGQAIQLLDAKGGLVMELWFAKAVPAKATAEQVKNGLTYREIPETTLVGAVRLPRQYTDYRKQKIKPGTYTLRLGYQPQDGDHMGTAAYSEFLLACPAAEDKKPDTMPPMALQELSKKATGGGHPGVFLLFPGGKDAGDAPKLVDKGEGHRVLFLKEAINAGGTKGTIGVGMTLIGNSPSA